MALLSIEWRRSMRGPIVRVDFLDDRRFATSSSDVTVNIWDSIDGSLLETRPRIAATDGGVLQISAELSSLCLLCYRLRPRR